MPELYEHQLRAMDQLKTGSILRGGVGSGKSRTALAYFLFKVCGGKLKINGEGRNSSYIPNPKDLYIITTAKKRDDKDWEAEALEFRISNDSNIGFSEIHMYVDSWNNIRKYRDTKDAFFIFDEQRVVGKGVWSKTFIHIARNNDWILLSATPGDQWGDYIPVFIANGFYKNRTEFMNMHAVWSRFSKFPKVERYMYEKKLNRHKDDITVYMDDQRQTVREVEHIIVDYNKDLYNTVLKNRWDPYYDEPIAETGKLIYLLRRVVNSDPTRVSMLMDLVDSHRKVIIFYNHNYEMDILREVASILQIPYGEWNGRKHDGLPTGNNWMYCVQYTAGCEGWNCTTTDTIIFFSQSYSYRQTEQAAGRIDRIDTKYKKLYYYHLRSESPIDKAIFKALKSKKNFNEQSFVRKNRLDDDSRKNLCVI